MQERWADWQVQGRLKKAVAIDYRDKATGSYMFWVVGMQVASYNNYMFGASSYHVRVWLASLCISHIASTYAIYSHMAEA